MILLWYLWNRKEIWRLNLKASAIVTHLPRLIFFKLVGVSLFWCIFKSRHQNVDTLVIICKKLSKTFAINFASILKNQNVLLLPPLTGKKSPYRVGCVQLHTLDTNLRLADFCLSINKGIEPVELIQRCMYIVRALPAHVFFDDIWQNVMHWLVDMLLLWKSLSNNLASACKGCLLWESSCGLLCI